MIPLDFQWSGEGMYPLNSRAAARQFVVGEVYHLEHREDRSARSHAHYFAAVNEAWQNLPDALAERFPTAEHLRKYALIHTGYRDERSVVCSSAAEARRLATFIRPMDDFAVVSVSGAALVVWTAKSQSTTAMGKMPFQQSKNAVLSFLASLIGVPPAQLTAARAA